MNKEIIIKNLDTDLEDIKTIISNGDVPICGRCRSPLVVAVDKESAKLNGVHPGVYCPTNENHFAIMIEIWDQETRNFYDAFLKKKDDLPGD